MIFYLTIIPEDFIFLEIKTKTRQASPHVKLFRSYAPEKNILDDKA